MSAETLRDLLEQYGKIVEDLNKSIDDATGLNNSLAIAKAEVSKNKHKLDLIKEQIMCEKKLIEVTK